jgi:hypothetical protein
MESSVILVKVDAVGFGVLHFSLVGFFSAGPHFTLMIGGIKRCAVFAGGVGLVIDALNFVAAPADEGVALFAECGAAAVAELSRSHF